MTATSSSTFSLPVPPSLISNRAVRWRALCAALLLATLTACGGGGDAPPPPPPTPPSITTQAQDASVIDGGSVSFTVSASGSGPLSYQWQRNGSNITGATDSRYTLAPARLTDSGAKFQVLVTGPGGSASSATVTLTVTPIALSLSQQPQSLAVADGSSASFTVKASGSEPISYQWSRDGVAIPGATDASYTTSVLGLADSKTQFQVTVSNPAGNVLSDKAALTVTPVAPSIVAQPASVSVADRAQLTLTVGAVGSAPLSYQWKRNGVAIPGANAASLSLSADYASSGDRYTVLLSNQVGMLESQAAVVTVNPLLPAFTAQPQAQTVATGASVEFAVAAGGTPPLNHQWQKSSDGGLSWAAVSGATGTRLKLAAALLADAGVRYRVLVSNPAGSVASQAAELRVQPQVRVLAGGLGAGGYAEGLGTLARFNFPSGIASAPDGSLYITDQHNHVVRRISSEGQTSLHLGQPGRQATLNGPREQALLSNPSALVLDGQGNLYIGEICAIRKLSSAGMLSTVAGRHNQCGHADGSGEAAAFSSIAGMVIDAAGNLVVADAGLSQVLRKVSPAGVVSTLAGAPGQSGSADGQGAAARFSNLGALAIAANGDVFATDGNMIRRITPAGAVSRYAGQSGVYGSAEGDRLTQASFGYPHALAVDAAGNLFVGDNNRIVRISASNGQALTAAGSAQYSGSVQVSRDGVGAAAVVANVWGMALRPNGQIAFTEAFANLVRLFSPSGAVSTLAGQPEQRGTEDGPAGVSRLNYPKGLWVEPASGEILVADSSNSRIRRLGSGGLLSTLAGSSWGHRDGPLAQALFQMPSALARDAGGNLYAADESSHVIRKITPGGEVSVFAGKPNQWGSADGLGGEARFYGPQGLAFGANGVLWVADTYNRTIRKIMPDGRVSTVAGSATDNVLPRDGKGEQARFCSPAGLAFDSQGRLFIADAYCHAIRQLGLDGSVTTFAGALNSPGYSDDAMPYVRFFEPRGIAFDARGLLYVADKGNHAIRRVQPDGRTHTVIGRAGAGVLRPGLDGSINAPLSVVVRPDGRLLFISEQAVLGD